MVINKIQDGDALTLAPEGLLDTVGTMRLINVNDSVKEVFKLTGFIDILTIV